KAFSMPRISTIGFKGCASAMDAFSLLCSCRETGAQAREEIGLSYPYVDQHYYNEDDPNEDIDPVLGNAEALEIELQERTHDCDNGCPCKRADHRAVTAEDRSAADD